MSLADKDLNLLVLFAAIWEERNLSRVAERLFLSQPAVSHALGRLREQFDDPLFVRSSKGMTPTEFAIRISGDVLALVEKVDVLYRQGKEFQPSECEQTLILATGDYFASTMAQRFITRINKEAPKVKVICYPDSQLFSPASFEQGKVHLGITGFYIEKREGFFSEKLIDDRIACCLRKKHPLSKSKFDLETYLEAEHLLVSVVGSSYGIVDQHLKKMRKKREVKVVVPSFFEAGAILAKTDLILTGPRGLCLHLAKENGLNTYETPFKTMPFPVLMHWHQRTDSDPFHSWVREMLLDVSSQVLQ